MKPLRDAMVGRVLSHYRIVDRIGSGGMGEVYLAEDLRLERRVAIKVLTEDSRASATRSARFEREMRAIAAIQHPNVVTLYDVEEVEGVRFLAMEHVEGETLAEAVPAGTKLELSRFLDIAIPLVDGLRAAHALGIAHRDLKPRNVMIDREGRVKLLDFGLAAWREGSRRSDSDHDLTRTGAVVGTPAYVSPEQLCGEPVDTRSDLFQLGVLFYELLAGQRPFLGSTPSELASSILRDRPEPLGTLRPDLPPALGQLVDRCLEKRVADRCQSAEELLEALRSLQLESQAQRITGRFEAAASRRRRRLVAVGWGAALAAAIAGVSAGMWWRDRAAGPQLEPHVVPVVTWSGLQSDAQLSPDGEWVSFLDSQFGPGDVYLQRVDGGEPQRLSEGASPALGHLWSQDGKHVALLVETGGRYLVQVFRPFSATAVRVLPLPEGEPFQRLVRWFETDLYLEGDSGLHRLGLESGVQELPLPREHEGGKRSHFDVSADGRRVVFVFARDGRTRAMVADLEGGSERMLTTHEGNDYAPRWIGPDSDMVVMSSDRGGRRDLWIVPVDRSKAARPLLSGSWEEEIDFTSHSSFVATFRESTRETDIHLLDPAATPDIAPVTSGSFSSGFASASGTGDLLAFQESDPRLAHTIYPFGSRVIVATLEPGELVRKRTDLGEGGLPLLSISGSRVALLRKLDRGIALVVREVASQYEWQVTDRFAFPGLALSTYELEARNLCWQGADELLFVSLGSDGGYELRRWSAQARDGSSEVLLGARGDHLIGDIEPAREGAPALALEWPASYNGTFAATEPQQFVVWAIPAEGEPTALSRVTAYPGEWVRLLGRTEGGVVVAVVHRNQDWSYRLRLLLLDGDRSTEAGVIDRAASPSVVFDARLGRVLFSTSDPRDETYNLFEQSLATSERRRLTFNRRPGTLFSDFVVLPERRILLSITSLTSTIHRLELREARSRADDRTSG